MCGACLCVDRGSTRAHPSSLGLVLLDSQTHIITLVCMRVLLQMAPGLPRPLVKICDFGYSKHDNRSVARSKVGTLTYMAPEVLQVWQGSMVLSFLGGGQGAGGRPPPFGHTDIGRSSSHRNRCKASLSMVLSFACPWPACIQHRRAWAMQPPCASNTGAPFNHKPKDAWMLLQHTVGQLMTG
jgi:hypothetical protein